MSMSLPNFSLPNQNGPPSTGTESQSPRYHPGSLRRRRRALGGAITGASAAAHFRGQSSEASSGLFAGLQRSSALAEPPALCVQAVLVFVAACARIRNGGAEGARTPDLLNAIEALSQLSYSPNRPAIVSERPCGGNRALTALTAVARAQHDAFRNTETKEFAHDAA